MLACASPLAILDPRIDIYCFGDSITWTAESTTSLAAVEASSLAATP
jgi:hypothetical protein